MEIVETRYNSSFSPTEPSYISYKIRLKNPPLETDLEPTPRLCYKYWKIYLNASDSSRLHE